MLSSKSRIATSVAAILAAAAALPAIAEEAPAKTDTPEIVVTGTFIRRSEGFAPASPVAEISKEDFEANAPKTVADFLTTLPYSFNSTFTVGRALGSSNGSGSINLRNLGPDATLVLLNSRRIARDPVTVSNVDVNALVPQIAIERVEILKDGASSLYGSDAIGGVANFLTRNKFEGFEFVAQSDTREEGRTTDARFSGLWGAHTEKTSAIVAVEYFKRSPYTVESLGILRSRAGTVDAEFRSNAWPGRYTVPNRTATGALATGAGSSVTVTDPLCSLFTGANTLQGPNVVRPGDPTAYPTACPQNVILGTSANADEKRFQGFAELHHEFSSNVKLFSEVGFLRTRTALVDNPGASINPAIGQPAVVVPGYAPGNLFRATLPNGTLLYAQPSGVTLNYTKPGSNGNVVVPLRNASGAVALNAGPDGIIGTADDSIGGVPFWEDATVVAGSRNLGLNCNLPGDPSTTVNCRSTLGQTRYQVDAFRIVTGFEGELGHDWHYETSYTFSSNSEADTTLGAAFSMPALRAALAGFGGSGCLTASNDPLASGTVRPGQGNCQFFNIFGNSVLATPGSSQANTVDIINYTTAQDWLHFQAETGVFDLVVSGPIVNLPAGPLGLAVGVQQRKETWSADYPALQNQGQSDLQAAFYDRDVAQTANAAFAEIDVPILKGGAGSLDFNGSLRHEKYKDSNLSTTDPKLGLLYSIPGDMVKVHGTWSTSFLAPSLYQRYRQNAAFTNNVVDGRNPTAPVLGRVTTLFTGNPDLKPQTSTNYDLGVTVHPIQSLNFDIDYWHYTFDNAILLENGLVIARDPNAPADKVVRDASGTIQQLNLTYINSSSIETAGLDFAVVHTLDVGRFGSIRNNLDATYQTTYKVNGIDRSGSRNATTGATFAIPWRATLRTDWQIGAHSVQSVLRYTDSYHNDAPPNAGSAPKTSIESYIQWDLAYTYGFEWDRIDLKNASASFGINNVLDKDPPYVPDFNHTLFSMYDYSGRHFWLRLKVDF